MTTSISFSQKRTIDSLTAILTTAKEDTNKVKVLSALAWKFKAIKPDTSLIIGKRSLKLAEKLNWKAGIAGANTRLGVYFMFIGNYDSSFYYHNIGLHLREIAMDKAGIANSLGNISTLYYTQGNYVKAIEYTFKGLRIDEEIGNKVGIEAKLGNIGKTYREMGEAAKALEFGNKALAMAIELKDAEGIARHRLSIGLANADLGKKAEAIENYHASLKGFRELENLNGEATVLGNLGILFSEKGDSCFAKENNSAGKAMNEKALSCFFQALKIAEQLEDINSVARHKANIGCVYLANKEYAKAESYLKEALKIDEKTGAVDGQKYRHEYLTKLYTEVGKYDKALYHIKLFKTLRDSLVNEENIKKTTQTQMQYDFDKREQAVRLEQDKKDLVIKEEKQKHQIVIVSVSLGLILVLVLAFSIFRSLRQNKRKNKIIVEQKKLAENQKELVEEKQKEILDSIYYARRIQRALITNEKYIEKNINRLTAN